MQIVPEQSLVIASHSFYGLMHIHLPLSFDMIHFDKPGFVFFLEPVCPFPIRLGFPPTLSFLTVYAPPLIYSSSSCLTMFKPLTPLSPILPTVLASSPGCFGP